MTYGWIQTKDASCIDTNICRSNYFGIKVFGEWVEGATPTHCSTTTHGSARVVLEDDVVTVRLTINLAVDY
jgi:hypothetical protein